MSASVYSKCLSMKKLENLETFSQILFRNLDQIYEQFKKHPKPLSTAHKLQLHCEKFVTEPKKIHLKMQPAPCEQLTSLNHTLRTPHN